jgi:glycerol-3-phosphate dehydrogenase
LSASPAIAEYVTEMLSEQGLVLTSNENYNPIRKPMHTFKNASIEEKNEIIKKNPSYGRIICRCETVSEGEILEAIRTNPPARDVDGIKRRTRSGMGRCQGGFCSPIVVQILARELGVGFEQIGKFGKGSTINYGKTKGVK